MKNIIKLASVIIMLAMVNNIFGQQNNFAFWADESFPQTWMQAHFQYFYEDGTQGNPITAQPPINYYGASNVQLYSIERQENKPGYLEVAIDDNLHYWWIKGGNPKYYYFEGDEYIEDDIHWEHGTPHMDDAIHD